MLQVINCTNCGKGNCHISLLDIRKDKICSLCHKTTEKDKHWFCSYECVGDYALDMIVED